MNSKIILFLALAFCSHAVSAQVDEETLALFPDLASISVPNDKSVSAEKPSEEVLKTQELFLEEEVVVPTKQDASSKAAAEETEDSNNEEAIFVTLTDSQGMLTSDRKSSYCSAVFKALNLTKKKLKLLSGQFTVGTTTHPFEFKDMAKEEVSGSRYMFLGADCEKILDTPRVDVRSCQLEKVSEAKCKKMVHYLVLPTKK